MRGEQVNILQNKIKQQSSKKFKVKLRISAVTNLSFLFRMEALALLHRKEMSASMKMKKTQRCIF